MDAGGAVVINILLRVNELHSKTYVSTDMRKKDRLGCVNAPWPPREEAARMRDHATHPQSQSVS